MSQTIKILTQHAIRGILAQVPGFEERSARRLLDVHLDPPNFPMGLQSNTAEAALRHHCLGTAPTEAARNLLVKEETRTIVGIARVMARTHINRQGVGDVTRGITRTQAASSPRVVGLFEGLRTEKDLRPLLDHRVLLDHWLAHANANAGAATPEAARFSPEDIASLRVLREMTPQAMAEATSGTAPRVAKQGWRKVVLGVHSGLKFLEDRYGLDADRVWEAIDGAVTAERVGVMVKEARRGIKEYGAALAGSFYADLGSGNFVKPDVHVVDCSAAASGVRTISEANAVATVHRLAQQSGLPPRAVDKLMFLGCSRRFFIGGAPRGAKEAKEQLLRELLAMAASARH